MADPVRPMVVTSIAPEPRASAPPAWRSPPAVVTAGFLLALIAVAAYLLEFGSHYPHEDDWETVHFVTGYWPMSLEWLWGPHNEHRMFLPRLVWWGLASAFGPDPRVVLWANLVLLAAAAAVFLGVARRLRGRVGYGDLVIPWALLSVTQYRNLLWATQLMWFLPVLFLAVAARAMVGRGGVRGSLLVAVLAALMILCGGPGLLWATPLIAWVVLRGILLWRGELFPGARARGPRRRWAGALVIAAGGLVVGLAAIYLHGLQRRVEDAPLKLDQVIAGCVEFLAVGISPGEVGRVAWIGALTGGLWVLALLCLLVRWGRPAAVAIRDPGAARRAALGLLAILGAVGALTLVLSYGRGPRVAGSCALPRYVLASSLVPVVLQLVAASSPRRWLASGISGLLLAMILWRAPANIQVALAFGETAKQEFAALDADIRAGVPATALARRHYRCLYDLPDQVRRVYFFLALMNHGRWHPFTGSVTLNLSAENLVEVDVPVRPVHVAGTTWTGRSGVAEGSDAQLWFALDRPRRVEAVRLRLAVQTRGNRRALVQVLAGRSGAAGAGDWSQCVEFWRLSGEVVETVEIPLNGEEIDQLRIDPDNRECAFELAGITLLVPGEQNR